MIALALALTLFYGVLADIDLITCGSVLKLQNVQEKVRLHSHDVKYGSGSGQQSVTGMPNSYDLNSHWQILGGMFFKIFVSNTILHGKLNKVQKIRTLILKFAFSLPASCINAS